jgi:alpha-amylase/alpha-mannosidase (GH57 family)
VTYLCVHGHFYQPPRENPWTGEIDLQESAAPFHDWNERILAESYGPNANPGPRPERERGRYQSNYERISFDFGPTLLSWMERKAPQVYAAILEADRASRARFSAHGSAMALAYNHMILPLANRRDRRTQVIWGIRDFEHRFHRSPEGMWLPETAADSATLEELARQSVRFTVLSPHQALRHRIKGEASWSDGPIDTRRPYDVVLSGGRRLAVFFYDGPASHSVAFGGLTAGGEALARSLQALLAGAPSPSLAAVATDGETFGHHFHGGERALAEALGAIERAGAPRLTNFAEYLAAYPPDREVEIREGSSWSCAHGLGRWSADCGCKTGEHPDWSQAWREPLRAAFDWLRDRLGELFEEKGSVLFADPWAARDDAVELWLDNHPPIQRRFLDRHVRRPLTGEEERLAFDLLDMQRNAMFMFTSCGWFFDDVGGLEGRQVLLYAGRAVELARRAGAAGLEAELLARLEAAKSNVTERGDARRLYEQFVGSASSTARVLQSDRD